MIQFGLADLPYLEPAAFEKLSDHLGKPPLALAFGPWFRQEILLEAVLGRLEGRQLSEVVEELSYSTLQDLALMLGRQRNLGLETEAQTMAGSFMTWEHFFPCTWSSEFFRP